MCQSCHTNNPIYSSSLVNQVEFVPLEQVRLTEGVFAHQQQVHADYLKMIDPNRLLAGFRKQAGLIPKAECYGGWEAKDIAGHSLGHYLSAIAYLYVATGDVCFADRASYIVDELAECQAHQRCGYALPVPRKLYEEVGRGKIETSPFSLNGCWVPNYTMHKVFAGLRDAYRQVGCVRALQVERDFADWLDQTWQHLTDDQIQHMLAAEHGGMNEVLADLSADTGENKYLYMAIHYFHHQQVLNPLLKGEDQLDGLHGNTQIPKLIGLAREYEQGQSPSYRHAAEAFWHHVVNQRSFANGGHGESEHFFPVTDFPRRLTPYTAETCNTYNLIKLTRSIFCWEPQAAKMDFVERAMLNHLLANIGKNPGEFGYFLGLGSVGVKVFSTPFDAWWCCVGTGMENPARYGELIYAYDSNDLYINLYMASTMQWPQKNFTLTQQTAFPQSDRVTLTVQVNQPTEMAINLRHPAWCISPMLSINGQAVDIHTKPGSYIKLSRVWRDGDVIALHLPMALRLEALPHSDETMFTVMYGPMLLAGIVPDEPGVKTNAPERIGDHLKARGKTDAPVPWLVTEHVHDLLERLRPLEHGFGHFVSVDAIMPQDLKFVPFYEIYDQQYAVYFKHLTPSQWQRQAQDIQKQHERQLAYEAATVDLITPGYQQPEIEHHVQSYMSQVGDDHGSKFREASRDGWFAYDMQVDPDVPMQLMIRYWGGEWQRRVFDIQVNDVTIATQTLLTDKPGDFLEVTYPIPTALTAGRGQVTVRLVSHTGKLGARVFHLRMVRCDMV
jgi:DUF1680 family protein